MVFKPPQDPKSGQTEPGDIQQLEKMKQLQYRDLRRNIVSMDEDDEQVLEEFSVHENEYQNEILNKEKELMRKAKDLEREMQSIKQAKIDVIVK